MHYERWLHHIFQFKLNYVLHASQIKQTVWLTWVGISEDLSNFSRLSGLWSGNTDHNYDSFNGSFLCTCQNILGVPLSGLHQWDDNIPITMKKKKTTSFYSIIWTFTLKLMFLHALIRCLMDCASYFLEELKVSFSSLHQPLKYMHPINRGYLRHTNSTNTVNK